MNRSVTSAAAPRQPLFVNRPRAYDVLHALGIDGLIALNPINVYYLTGSRPIFQKFGRDIPAMATFARDPSQPSFLIAHIHETQNALTGEREHTEIIPYSSPVHGHDGPHEGEPAASPSRFPAGPYDLTERERQWMDAHDRYAATLAPSAAWGVARALRQSGLDRGRVAVDDMRIAHMLQGVG